MLFSPHPHVHPIASKTAGLWGLPGISLNQTFLVGSPMPFPSSLSCPQLFWTLTQAVVLNGSVAQVLGVKQSIP